MPKIVETVVTTMGAAGDVHIAPLGLIADGDHYIIAPFRPSRTLDNLTANPMAVASHTDDVRVIAGCITGRRDWPTVPADRVRGVRLADCVSHSELEVVRVDEDKQRPRFFVKVAHQAAHRPWGGYNRAQAAVLELAILSTRLHMLPADKVEAELKYLEIAIEKTAGDREREAWGWLMERIAAWRAGDEAAKQKL
ncbi:MAG: DUF447 family protein [Hyphomicrobium sp.]|nr:DUF447 family protein [Hyphomicrobium sp.]